MSSLVDKYACTNLGDDRNGLDSKWISINLWLGESLFVVPQPEQKHSLCVISESHVKSMYLISYLEGKGFKHAADDREGGKDITALS